MHYPVSNLYFPGTDWYFAHLNQQTRLSCKSTCHATTLFGIDPGSQSEHDLAIDTTHVAVLPQPRASASAAVQSIKVPTVCTAQLAQADPCCLSGITLLTNSPLVNQ